MNIPRPIQRRVVLPALRRLRPLQTLRVDGRDVTVDVRDPVIGTLLYLTGEYEPELARCIAALEPHLRGGVAVDVGANLGLHAQGLASAVGPRGTVLAIEPEPHNVSLLRRNTAGAGNVIVHPCAAGAESGVARLAVNRDNFGDHRVGSNSSGAAIEVPIATVDSLVATANARPGDVRFVKMDVQGYEARALRGMEQTIAANPGLVLALELWPLGLRGAGDSAPGVVAWLRDLGFDGFEIHPQRVVRLLDPAEYARLQGASYVDLLLCRDAGVLEPVVAGLYPAVL